MDASGDRLSGDGALERGDELKERANELAHGLEDDEAIDLFRKAIAAYDESISAGDDMDDQVLARAGHVGKAEALRGLAEVQSRHEPPEEVLEVYEAAMVEHLAASVAGTGDAQVLKSQAMTMISLAGYQDDAGSPGQALAAAQMAIFTLALISSGANGESHDAALLSLQAMAVKAQGLAHEHLGDREAAIADYREAAAGLDAALAVRIPAQEPDTRAALHAHRGDCLARLGGWLGETPEGETTLREAVASYDEALRLQPSNAVAKSQKGMAHCMLGSCLAEAGRQSEALEQFRRGLAELDDISGPVNRAAVNLIREMARKSIAILSREEDGEGEPD